jgi:hypothetical protein
MCGKEHHSVTCTFSHLHTFQNSMAILSFLQQTLFAPPADSPPQPQPTSKPDRSSLVHRTRPGKEGSRRRQRYDNGPPYTIL